MENTSGINLWAEIVPYTDSLGLVSPSIVVSRVWPASNNGVMYTSELYVIASKLGIMTKARQALYDLLLHQCIHTDGTLNRTPVDVPAGGQEGPDDYYAALNACMQLGIVDAPQSFLKAAIVNLGALNNIDSGKWTFQSFLIRQPQLLVCMVSASFPSLKNPLHWLIRVISFPLYLYSAIIISFSGILSDPNEVNTRRLTWHTLQTLKPVSLLCFLASKIWYKRLYKDYGPEGMKAVSALYYEKGHPFSRYWVD